MSVQQSIDSTLMSSVNDDPIGSAPRSITLRSLRSTLVPVALISAALTLSGCSTVRSSVAEVASIFDSGKLFGNGSGKSYSDSGTIIISRQAPPPSGVGVASARTAEREQLASSGAAGVSQDPKSGMPRLMAPLVGYFPPAGVFVPAENETWIEINRERGLLSVFRGKEVVKEAKTEGSVSLPEGDYYLQHKQAQPLWYAPNDYFKKRQLLVPEAENRLRYRRGALGQFALYPTTTFPIHCGPIWSEDVGGLRVSPQDMASIYHLVPLGSPVVVK